MSGSLSDTASREVDAGHIQYRQGASCHCAVAGNAMHEGTGPFLLLLIAARDAEVITL
jgi:hypothetical protein